jgi:hypothetical protein
MTTPLMVAQYASDDVTSLPAIVPSAHQVVMPMEFLITRTATSQNRM